jgi:ureidoacrylate peracid hydrolase
MADPDVLRDTALIVVDMQNDYCHPQGVYPRHGFSCFSIDDVVVKTVSTVKRCRELGIPVIYLRMVWRTDGRGYPVDAGLIVDESRPFLRQEGLRGGTWGAKILEQMPEGDYIVDKTRYSGFYNTALETLLRGLHVDRVLLAGVTTNMCVEATARDAFHRDLRFAVLSDCVSSFDRELHHASLKTLAVFGRIGASTELLGRGTPARLVAPAVGGS